MVSFFLQRLSYPEHVACWEPREKGTAKSTLTKKRGKMEQEKEGEGKGGHRKATT
jgi:hypothetical protein